MEMNSFMVSSKDVTDSKFDYPYRKKWFLYFSLPCFQISYTQHTFKVKYITFFPSHSIIAEVETAVSRTHGSEKT